MLLLPSEFRKVLKRGSKDYKAPQAGGYLPRSGNGGLRGDIKLFQPYRSKSGWYKYHSPRFFLGKCLGETKSGKTTTFCL